MHSVFPLLVNYNGISGETCVKCSIEFCGVVDQPKGVECYVLNSITCRLACVFVCSLPNVMKQGSCN